MLTRPRAGRASAPFVHDAARRARGAVPSPRRRLRWTLASRVLVLQLLVVSVVTAGCSAALVWQLRADGRRDAAELVTAVAGAVATDPGVRTALAVPGGTTDPALADERAAVRVHVEEVRERTGADFITVMDTATVRWTHPDPARVGGRFLGNAAAALAGGRVVETYTGTLGPSVRAVVPVRAADGRVVGAVAAGVTTRTLAQDLLEQLPLVLGAAAAALAVSVAGSLALSRWGGGGGRAGGAAGGPARVGVFLGL